MVHAIGSRTAVAFSAPDLGVSSMISRSRFRQSRDGLIEAHRQTQEALEGEAVARDREIVTQVSAPAWRVESRVLTPEQEASMLERLAGKRVDGD